MTNLTIQDIPHIILEELAKSYPNTDVTLAKIAQQKAALTLPKKSVHEISDIHGEAKKLKHVINNASGSLRILVTEIFGAELSAVDQLRLLTLIYYPRETYTSLLPQLKDEQARRVFIETHIRHELRLLKALSTRYAFAEVEAIIPAEYRNLFRELLFDRASISSERYLSTVIEEFLTQGMELDLLRILARMIRNLLIAELVVAGDLGDRGERIDRVIEYLIRQPNVAITWGNHDVTWIGACLGDKLCIATVLRISLRYGRLEQLEEGYGIPLTALEKLATQKYAGDPAAAFSSKIESNRPPELLAKMQKAMAIIQCKLEGQTIQRNPHFELGERALLHRIDPNKGTIIIEGKEYPLTDTNFPTIAWNDPYRLSPEEEACISTLRDSFLQSPMLWRHISYVVRRGTMYLIRDHALIFHACVPCTPQGDFIPFKVDGISYTGKALFDAIQRVVARVIREKAQSDLDLLWYLWCGPLSPLFGKDRMATFEGYFIDNAEVKKEHNNSYFSLLHEKEFCKKVLAEFGLDRADGLIVNGHIPVKLDKGESPVKRSGMAVTIDGAFSEAYGDKGFTLVLEASKTFLAQHHHFESVSDAILKGSDIIPEILDLRTFSPHRTIGDTEEGDSIQSEIELLELLIEAYRENVLPETRR